MFLNLHFYWSLCEQSPDVLVNAPADPFAKPIGFISQNVSLRADIDRVQYSTVQLRDKERNESGATDLERQLPNSNIHVGVASVAPAQSVGYVTLGQATDGAFSSPNVSHNWSVGNNEPASELRASSTSGYVAYESQGPVELDRSAISSPLSPSTSGYVTLGANSAGTTPTVNETSTHYVKMGTQSDHLSYI